MHFNTIHRLVAIALPALAFCQATSATDALAAEAAPRLSGPFTHDNLAIFLVHGEDRLKGRKLTPLADAIRQKKVIVHETGNVGELSIENKSKEDVFVQAGDIVKGGQQDRVLSLDVILPPNSGRIPVASFCVESGRWRKRGGESHTRFESSTATLGTKALKMAARKEASQGKVWEEVANTQKKLGSNLNTEVRSSESDSSLMLTLENGRVQNKVSDYTKKLARIIEGKGDVVGYVFAINGQVNSAEIYASPAMFKMQWSKLLEASAVEAIAEFSAQSKAVPPSETEVQKFLSVPSGGSGQKSKTITERTKLNTVEHGDQMLFETEDSSSGWIHRSYY